MESGDKAAALIKSYGESWTPVVAAPAAALFMVSTADLSGPIGSVKEAQAAGKALLRSEAGAAWSHVPAAVFDGVDDEPVRSYRLGQEAQPPARRCSTQRSRRSRPPCSRRRSPEA